MAIQAGKLRHIVTVQRPAKQHNSFGEEKEIWISTNTRRCDIVPTSARERLLAEQVNQQLTHRVTMRYTPDIKHDYRLLFGSRVLNIESIINVDERNKELTLMCKEVT